MTDSQYKDLQAWCAKSSNKRSPYYKLNVDLRNHASQLRARIRGYRAAIVDAIRILEQCKDQYQIDKWTRSVNKSRDEKKALQIEFNNLPMNNSVYA